MGAVTAGSRRGHRDHEVVEFNTFSVRRKKKRQNCHHKLLKRANFKLLREQISSVPYNSALQYPGAQESWSLLKKRLSKACEQAMPLCHVPSKWGSWPG